MSAGGLEALLDNQQRLVAELIQIMTKAARTPAATIEQLAEIPVAPTMVAEPFELTYISRRIRDEAMAQPGLFGEAAWDILLALASSKDPMTVTALCEASRVPTSEAVRYVAEMERRGMIERRELELQRLGLQLTPPTKQRMAAYAEKVRQLAEKLVEKPRALVR